MILEVYVLLQVLTIVALIVTFYSEAPLYAVMTMVLSGVLMIGAWVLETGVKYVWEPAIRAYSQQPILVQTPYLAYINMAIFGLAIVYFFYDLFNNVNKQTKNLDSNMNNMASGGSK